jgi:diketogulonate reductase-like aldo/keto reductase
MSSSTFTRVTMTPMPQVTIPAFLYGTAWKEDRTASLTERALRAGFRGIDTANQRRHYFEAGVGEALSAAYAAGVLTRADVFLQTKFTYQRGQDHRLPYDPSASLATQVAQSLASSLEHLGTDHVDSYVLHGPSSNYDWAEADTEVWETMREQRDAGRTHLLGVSNVSLQHLEQMKAAGAEMPAFVQNRCFARLGWDREVRAFCGEHQIIYQGFSLLTANPEVLEHPPFVEAAKKLNVTPAQVVFAFARAIRMLPITGTSTADHMKQDLASLELTLPPDLVNAIEGMAG